MYDDSNFNEQKQYNFYNNGSQTSTTFIPQYDKGTKCK